MIRLDSKSMVAGPVSLKVPDGQYAALLLRVAGTNDAGQTLTKANLGMISMSYRGQPVQHFSFSDAWEMTEMDLGEPEWASAVGAAFSGMVAIPASRAGDGNIFHIEDADDCHIGLDLSGVSGVVLSGTVRLFGVPKIGIMRYIPNVLTNTPEVPTGSTVDQSLTMENLCQIYLTTPTNLASLALSLDKETVVDCTWEELQNASNLDCRIEAAYTAGARINLHRSGDLVESLNDTAKMVLIAGAGGAANPHIILVGLDYVPDAVSNSSARIDSLSRVRMVRKANLHRSRPITVAKMLAGGR